jgi:hypothetical protein
MIVIWEEETAEMRRRRGVRINIVVYELRW